MFLPVEDLANNQQKVSPAKAMRNQVASTNEDIDNQ